jgi:hypothetical protein
VTRFGEFSPNGQLFNLGSLLKNTDVAQIAGLIFKSYVFILTKMGYITGDFFFTNSSGDPVVEAKA